MRVGMRTIKTAISVGVCVFALKLLGITPAFAAIAAIYTVEADVPTSFRNGMIRISGTFAGALIGSVFLIISSFFPMENILISSLIVPIGLICLINLLNFLKLKDSIFTGGIVYLLLMLQVEGPMLKYAVTRSLTTVFGVAVALLVNYFVFPNRAKQNSN